MKNPHALVAAAFLALAPVSLSADVGHPDDDAANEHTPLDNLLAVYELDAANGRALFAEKGCAACHAVNGVGGEDATSLDAHDMDEEMNPFELAAKMWTMAPYMIAAQEDELGEQITFTGAELGDIVAFLHDDAEQHKFTEESLSDELRGMIAHEDEPGEEDHQEEEAHD